MLHNVLMLGIQIVFFNYLKSSNGFRPGLSISWTSAKPGISQIKWTQLTFTSGDNSHHI